jgi:hypothetical protein
MAEQLDREGMKAWIMRRLGAPVVKVELTECHIEDAIDSALRWFIAKKGLSKQYVLTVQTGVGIYTLPDFVETVYDVIFPVPGSDLSVVFNPYLLMDEHVPFDIFAASHSGGLYSTLVQTQQYIESAKRILGAEGEWRQNGNILQIWPAPVSGGAVVIEYKASSVTVEQLNERDYDLLRRYALAMAKRDLGRIRSKHSEHPTADGSISLDGDRLLEEAQAEIEALDEELSASAMGMGWITG